MKKKAFVLSSFWERKQIGTAGPKFLSHGKHKGYRKLLVSTGSMPGMDKSPTQDEYESALEGNKDVDKNCKIR